MNIKLTEIEKKIRQIHDELSPEDAIYDFPEVIDGILTLREAYFEEVITAATVNKDGFAAACGVNRPNALLSVISF